MREHCGSGWMHNRVRMIVASFLTNDLMIPWQAGARWFWDTLIDADLANNTLGWQWAAGSGADAQPIFRIFNPTSQSRKHDPDGKYTREWVEELSESGDAVRMMLYSSRPDRISSPAFCEDVRLDHRPECAGRPRHADRARDCSRRG